MRLVTPLLLCLAGLPLCAQDLILPLEQVARGATLFTNICASCHGADATGDSAPDITGMIRKDVRQAVKGIEAMPAFDLTDAEIDDVTAYLMSRAPDQARARLSLSRRAH